MWEERHRGVLWGVNPGRGFGNSFGWDLGIGRGNRCSSPEGWAAGFEYLTQSQAVLEIETRIGGEMCPCYSRAVLYSSMSGVCVGSLIFLPATFTPPQRLLGRKRGKANFEMRDVFQKTKGEMSGTQQNDRQLR